MPRPFSLRIILAVVRFGGEGHDDAVHYLEQMAFCKYYIAIGTITGAGQAICLGQQDKSYHRLICHPAALCASMIELPRRVRAIAESEELHGEILTWQERALRDFFQRAPIAQLEKAISIKNNRLAAAGRHA